MSAHGHKHTGSVTQNHKAQLANAYNELGKELSSSKIRVVGNYTLGKVIGEGAYGKVRLGTHRITSTRVAIKQIPKAMSASLTREIHHHRQLQHPHVTQMYEVIATESHIWIVTELCCGGELFDYLAEKGRLSERESSIIFGQLALAVAYLHEKGIVHRDLKLENVLLDERCRVKLGDFGFTREYDRGVYMETFCGTTGYAAPEMLQGKRYLGPEVDVWSMGVILYCLLTGTLPFDDDDEAVMKEKVIKGKYEDPEWLSTDARDLVRNILEVDPAKRLTIPQILASPWFTCTPSAPVSDQVLLGINDVPPSPSPARDTFILPVKPIVNTQTQVNEISISPATSTTSESFVSASSHLSPSPPATPDNTPKDPFNTTQGNGSQTTITKDAQRSQLSKDSMTRQPETVIEEEPEAENVAPSAAGSVTNLDQIPKAPPYPTRTPARTKRRSVSSTLSDSGSPTLDKPLAPLPPQDFASLLSTPAPIIFSTPAERDLLNSLSLLGFDTSQIVHSVLSNACDAAGAIWWMLKRKREKRVLAGEIPLPPEFSEPADSKQRVKDEEKEDRPNSRRRPKRGIGVQTDDVPIASSLGLIHRAPELALLPPTPTVPSSARPTTPPRAKSPFLSPSPTTAESSGRSNPSTPTGSFRDKDKDNKGRRDSKARSGSVSIMQRATNALEIAGLVRKKSNEAVKGEDKERERERSREHEKRTGGGEEPRNSGNSSKLTKSPPLKPKDQVIIPTTPSVAESSILSPLPGSPWVVTGGRTSPPQSHAPTPANSPGDTLTSLPNFSDDGKVVPPNRNRASLLSAFRLWFQEDKKGKRKEAAQAQGSGRGLSYSRSLAIPPTVSMSPGGHANVKRRGSGTGRGRRVKRHSTSSRRSSSVNSHRSSGNSGQLLVLEPPQILEQIPSVRSYGGAHTPGSDRGEYSSRPSSIHSVTLGKHRKSPSTGSNGSAHYRNSSPMHKYHHRRAGSSSSTRVIRHQAGPRPVHHRTSSATSSVHSLASSRPTSFYEASEGEGTRTSSPYKSYPSRRSLDDTPRRGITGSATFVAHKRITPFMSPFGTTARTGWKESWGHEPPGWQSRSTHLPVEVLSISPGPEGPANIRDVFTGRQSLNLGDESDWVDEDDDMPEFAGGLGQMPSSSSTNSSFTTIESPTPMSPPARNHNSRSGKGRTTSAPPNSNGRARQGNSPARPSPVPTENVFDASDTRAGRRQLPTSRSGPAFRHPIQEEDEGEEE
ncbi:Pkinase-domain-containing protein [Suillus plorans]|uniref:Pkinase-domain-containing protein n=1 Tax=Suillus plorans TaxID=116603 RepID=A0A9P7AGP1_9AGAM|nr:Pkinase-domain-containing protein [Suillus plorans]KAG1789070.1 Pkinase-domain-containing protein [Suillus plorans]